MNINWKQQQQKSSNFFRSICIYLLYNDERIGECIYLVNVQLFDKFDFISRNGIPNRAIIFSVYWTLIDRLKGASIMHRTDAQCV